MLVHRTVNYARIILLLLFQIEIPGFTWGSCKPMYGTNHPQVKRNTRVPRVSLRVPTRIFELSKWTRVYQCVRVYSLHACTREL